MDLLVIVLAAALGTALGGGLALLAQRMSRSGGVETELHILRDRLHTMEAAVETAQGTLGDAQRLADERMRLLDRQTLELRAAQEQLAAAERELEKNVERRQAAERRADELILERDETPAPNLEGSNDLIRLQGQLEAEMQKSQALEAEIARRDEESAHLVVLPPEPSEADQLRVELEAERERVNQLLKEIGVLLSQQPAPAEAAGSGEAAIEIERLTAELAEERRLRAEAMEATAGVDASDATERLTAEVARLSAALVEEKRLREDESASLAATLDEERQRARQSSEEIARLTAALAEAQAAQQTEAERATQTAEEIAALTQQLADAKLEVEGEAVRGHELANEVMRLTDLLDRGQSAEAEDIQRLNEEVARLTALAADERNLREVAVSERSALEAQIVQERQGLIEANRLREEEAARREELAAELARERESAARLDEERRQLAATAEQAAQLSAEIEEHKRGREETASQLALVETQLSAERNRSGALEAERVRLLAQVEDERRIAAKSKEMLALAQDRMASVFAVFSGEPPKANGHLAAVTPDAPIGANGSAKQDSEIVPVV
jgi:chromosome segregation ATPase